MGEGSKKGGRDPVSRTNFNQIPVSCILEKAEFTNHVSFLAIFTRHSLIFAIFSRATVKFLPYSCHT